MSVFKRWNGTSWEVIGPQISSTRFDDINHMIAPEYDPSSTYNIGDYVVQNDNLYKCIITIESAEEWTETHWNQISISKEVNTLNDTLNDIIGNGVNITDLSIYNPANGILTNNATWSFSNSSYTRSHIAIPIPSTGCRVTMTGGNYNTYYGVVKSYTIPTAQSDIVDYSDATGFTSRLQLNAGATVIFDLPDDATYLIICTIISNNDTTPSSFLMHKDAESGIIVDIQTAINKSAENKLNSYIDAVKPFPNAAYIKDTNGQISTHTSALCTDLIPIDNLMYAIDYSLCWATNSFILAFYDANTQYITGSGIAGTESGAMVQGTATIPTGAKYFRAGTFSPSIYPNYYVQGKYKTETIISKLNDNIIALEDIDKIEENKLNSYIAAEFPNSAYIRDTNGGISTHNSALCTDLIPIDDFVYAIEYNLCWSINSLIVAFYDVNSHYISGSGIIGTEPNAMVQGTATIPANAKYFRACTFYPTTYLNYYARKKYKTETIISELDNTKNILTETDKIIKTLNYVDSINKPFVFSGKQITAFGDSITSGVTSPGLVAGTPYIRYFADHVGATLVNRAVSGQRFADDSTNSIYTRITTYTNATDVIWIAGGTNDYQLGSALGSFESIANVSTFYGALKAICAYLKTNYSNTPVIFMTPIPYTDIDEYAPNSAGYTLNDYRTAIFEVATANEYSVVNGAGLGLPTVQGGWGNIMIDDTDGCHPTEAGHKMMARSLAGKLL